MREEDLIDALFDGLAKENAAVDEEQAVRGLDHLKELALHPLLAGGLQRAGFFVAREQRYPSAREKKQRSSGRRCDLVVTVDGPLLLEDAQPGLFDLPMATPADAAWLEVKVLKQHGPRGPNRGWQDALLAPPTVDVARLAADDGLGLRALVLLLFTASVDVAVHDAGVWRQHVLARGFSLGPALLRHLAIKDRVGNNNLTLAWMPVSSTTRLG